MRRTCGSPGVRRNCWRRCSRTGTPVVLVLLVGRPYELSRQIDRLAAVVCGFFPGEEGGPAIAGVLDGTVNPSGRLPISFPRSGASQPTTYLASPLGKRSEVSSVDPTPLFPFGHGLSYAPATWLPANVVGATRMGDQRCGPGRGHASATIMTGRQPRSCRSTCTMSSPRRSARSSS